MFGPPSLPAWVDGTLYPPGAPALSAYDLGFQLGLAVFDTLLYERECLMFAAEHVRRIRSGAAELGIREPYPWSIEDALGDYTRTLGARDCAVRLTITRGVPGRGPTLVVYARSIDRPRDPGVAVRLEPDAKIAGQVLERVKSTNRLRNVLAREAAQRTGAWEALLLTDDGDVSEGTTSNVFAVVGGELVTPALDRGCLAGVTRDVLLRDLAAAGRPAREGRLEVRDLGRASEVFLTNTTGRIVPVIAVQEVAERLPGAAGPVTGELRARLAGIEERYRAAARGAARIP